jgi:hypothetical protein
MNQGRGPSAPPTAQRPFLVEGRIRGYDPAHLLPDPLTALIVPPTGTPVARRGAAAISIGRPWPIRSSSGNATVRTRLWDMGRGSAQGGGCSRDGISREWVAMIYTMWR